VKGRVVKHIGIGIGGKRRGQSNMGGDVRTRDAVMSDG